MYRGLERLGYRRARLFLLGIGLAVLVLIAFGLFVRRVDTPEVVAVLLFIPVFLGFVFGNITGGLVLGVGAAVTYAGLRYPAIKAIGASSFISLIITRSVSYIAFGALGGWANRQLASSLGKLELYDQIDDLTGLFNARFLHQDVDLEVSRSRRYHTAFSVAVAEVADSALQQLGKRKAQTALRELGGVVRDSVRTVDRAAVGHTGDHHLFAVVLPETGPEGARIFTERFQALLTRQMTERGAPSGVSAYSVSYPDDEEGVARLREAFVEADREEHPEASSA